MIYIMQNWIWILMYINGFILNSISSKIVLYTDNESNILYTNDSTLHNLSRSHKMFIFWNNNISINNITCSTPSNKSNCYFNPAQLNQKNWARISFTFHLCSLDYNSIMMIQFEINHKVHIKTLNISFKYTSDVPILKCPTTYLIANETLLNYQPFCRIYWTSMNNRNCILYRSKHYFYQTKYNLTNQLGDESKYQLKFKVMFEVYDKVSKNLDPIFKSTEIVAFIRFIDPLQYSCKASNSTQANLKTNYIITNNEFNLKCQLSMIYNQSKSNNFSLPKGVYIEMLLQQSGDSSSVEVLPVNEPSRCNLSICLTHRFDSLSNKIEYIHHKLHYRSPKGYYDTYNLRTDQIKFEGPRFKIIRKRSTKSLKITNIPGDSKKGILRIIKCEVESTSGSATKYKYKWFCDHANEPKSIIPFDYIHYEVEKLVFLDITPAAAFPCECKVQSESLSLKMTFNFTDYYYDDCSFKFHNFESHLFPFLINVFITFLISFVFLLSAFLITDGIFKDAIKWKIMEKIGLSKHWISENVNVMEHIVIPREAIGDDKFKELVLRFRDVEKRMDKLKYLQKPTDENLQTLMSLVGNRAVRWDLLDESKVINNECEVGELTEEERRNRLLKLLNIVHKNNDKNKNVEKVISSRLNNIITAQIHRTPGTTHRKDYEMKHIQKKTQLDNNRLDKKTVTSPLELNAAKKRTDTKSHKKMQTIIKSSKMEIPKMLIVPQEQPPENTERKLKFIEQNSVEASQESIDKKSQNITLKTLTTQASQESTDKISVNVDSTKKTLAAEFRNYLSRISKYSMSLLKISGMGSNTSFKQHLNTSQNSFKSIYSSDEYIENFFRTEQSLSNLFLDAKMLKFLHEIKVDQQYCPTNQIQPTKSIQEIPSTPQVPLTLSTQETQTTLLSQPTQPNLQTHQVQSARQTRQTQPAQQSTSFYANKNPRVDTKRTTSRPYSLNRPGSNFIERMFRDSNHLHPTRMSSLRPNNRNTSTMLRPKRLS